MLTMGIIGFGKSANRYHLPYIRLRENIRVKTIVDISAKEELQENYQDIHFTKQFEDILNDPEIQLVTISTPASTHYELAEKAIKAGKSVIVEKPFCSTVEEARTLLELGRKYGVMVMPFQNRRFDGDYLALKQVVEQGYIGELLEIESHFDYFRPNEPTRPGPAVEGSFYGLGIHTIDRMIALFGRPEKVAYDIRSIRDAASTDDYFDVDLHYSKGFKVKVKTSHVVATSYPQIILHGTKGSFIKYGIDQQENDLKAGIYPDAPGFGHDSPNQYGQLHYQNANGDWIDKQIPTPIGDYGRIYDAAYETIIHGAPKLVSDEEIITNIEILQAGFLKPSPSIYQLGEL